MNYSSFELESVDIPSDVGFLRMVHGTGLNGSKSIAMREIPENTCKDSFGSLLSDERLRYPLGENHPKCFDLN